MVTLAGLWMPVIVVEHFVQVFFVFIAALRIEPIDVLVKFFDILALVNDLKGCELDITEVYALNLSLTDMLNESVVLIEECLPEILYRDIL